MKKQKPVVWWTIELSPCGGASRLTSPRGDFCYLITGNSSAGMRRIKKDLKGKIEVRKIEGKRGRG